MRKGVWLLAGVGVVAVAGVGLAVTQPQSLPASALAGVEGDAARGAQVYAAAGCGSCHGAEDTEALAGGAAFASPFGTFYAPNISTHADQGIGGWSDYELANAIRAGVSPEGQHYYPAFPYTSYARMTAQDTADLIAHLRTLPADATPSRGHDVGFPFNIRRSLGGWKFLFASDDWVVTDAPSPEVERGRYLVEALGHCGECHTPRNALGGLKTDQWLRGAANPAGDGRIPSIHPDDLGWSAQDIAIYLESGFTPDFDTVGGEMVEVVENTAKLADEDRNAIAAYLVALP
ncbi:c-type cytochrome [Thalassorhabdomicrobium marinisediminis]|uniref:Diacylglycerol kinase n=1 Tax=Thalassorhabdomicrobium marinisediminis TaxID=2170577 RepID=A0A2T7FUV7_9RHOB|nr:cytochrome c [Thalassorhabdomicrobium marinisediminis]PVA05947.1 diacylglycerol kinase [Thalassorhabdomicrobium marinisediminis]